MLHKKTVSILNLVISMSVSITLHSLTHPFVHPQWIEHLFVNGLTDSRSLLSNPVFLFSRDVG